MKRRLYVLLAVVLPVLVSAQTITTKLQWDLPVTPATALTYAFAMQVTPAGGTMVTKGLSNVLCVANGTGARCSAPIMPEAPGTSILLVTYNNGGSTPAAAPYVVGGAPPAATGVTIVVTLSTIP